MNRHESDSLNSGYCEFLTPVKVSGKYILFRLLIVLTAITSAVAMLSVTLKTVPVISFMCLVMIIFFSWFIFQFTKVEYEYVIATGELTLTQILGARTRKDILQFKTSDIYAITALDEMTSLNIGNDNIFYACDKTKDNALCIAYSAENGTKKVLVISAPPKTVSCLKHYRRTAFSSTLITKA